MVLATAIFVMTNNYLSMTELAKMAQSQRALALKQQDSALLTGLSLAGDDDSHLDLTARIRFLEACGGPPPFVLERVDESGNIDRYGFERPFLIVGRSAACEIACRTRSVSFRHLYLQHLGGVVWWFDLDSRAGTLCDGQKRRAGCLVPGMTIEVGEYSLRLSPTPKPPAGETGLAAPATRPSTLSASQLPGLPQVSLEFENGRVGSEKKQTWAIENSITLLGRRSCCDIRFADESVSRVHASLILTNEGLWAVDLLGRGGTKVNGVPSAYAYLHDGSQMEIGGYKIRVKYADRAAQPHPAEAVLDEEPKQNRNRTGSETRTVSEDLLYDLVTNLAQMQKQMFDQSQMQMGLLIQMLGSIHQSQQEMLKEELNRVHEISREMRELQRRLTAQEKPKTDARSAPAGPSRIKAAESAVEIPEQGDEFQVPDEMDDVLPAPSLFSQEDEADEAPPIPPEDAPKRTDRMRFKIMRFCFSGCRISSANATADCKKSSAPSAAADRSFAKEHSPASCREQRSIPRLFE